MACPKNDPLITSSMNNKWKNAKGFFCKSEKENRKKKLIIRVSVAGIWWVGGEGTRNFESAFKPPSY